MPRSRNLEPLLRSAVTLVMASSGIVSGCDPEVGPGIEDDPGFVTLSCEDPDGDLLRGLTPEPAVDYLELRLVGANSMSVVASAGEVCATAQNESTCLTQVMESTVTGGFRLGECF